MRGLKSGKRTMNRNDASCIVRFLMACYHEGVYDAYKYDDDTYCQQFVADHKRKNYYGILDNDYMTLDNYQYTLMLYARNNNMPSFGLEILMNLTGSSVLPLLCQRFYVQGVDDFISTANYLRMDSFREDIWQFWVGAKSRESVKKSVIQRLQEYCLEMKEVAANEEQGKRIVDFGHAMWLLTRPIGYGVKHDNKTGGEQAAGRTKDMARRRRKRSA